MARLAANSAAPEGGIGGPTPLPMVLHASLYDVDVALHGTPGAAPLPMDAGGTGTGGGDTGNLRGPHPLPLGPLRVLVEAPEPDGPRRAGRSQLLRHAVARQHPHREGLPIAETQPHNPDCAKAQKAAEMQKAIQAQMGNLVGAPLGPLVAL